ncbi:MAG: nucleotidyl transferase AbiEii/AbiGii toxin family protein [Bacteroidetes bacterium]|nr:MAG: nucleotidyl transferase AbiEii/AbiGii toxin family protein [Bacteroidota bacterium]
MKVFYQLPDETKERIFRQTGTERGIPAFAVEKDWWVVQTLRIIFSMDMAKHLVFKGGTSLSKAWNLISRFSEDIDIALDKAALGIEDVRTKKQVKTLRNKSKKFIKEEFLPELKEEFTKAGFDEVEIKIPEGLENDPLSIEIYYPYVTQYSKYINPRILVEIGSRSLKEPFVERPISTYVSEQFPEQDFADEPINIAVTSPEKTFLEKIFLLHEEFQKEEVRTNRLTRHFYDIEKIMDTDYAEAALSDPKLYQTIVQHRKLLFSISTVDYNLHQPQTINLIPPDKLLKDWENDYKKLNESMVYGDILPWEELLGRIRELMGRINKLEFRIEIE